MAKVAGLPAKLSFEQAYNLDAKAPYRLYFPEETARHVVDSLLFKKIQDNNIPCSYIQSFNLSVKI